MQANGNPKCVKNRVFEKKVPKVVWTHYLLYILTTGTLRKPHFCTPRSKQNASLFRVVPRIPPRSCKVAPMGPKNGESGLPWAHQGCQRVPQCLQRCSQKSSKIVTPPGLPPRVLLGCLGYPNVPKIRHGCPAQGTRHNTKFCIMCLLSKCTLVHFRRSPDRRYPT